MDENRQYALDRFLEDTKHHKMDVLLDDGVYRHLKFTKDGSSIYRFDIHTWPGYLCVCGDMGTYVFSRLSDMFEFFRSDTGELKINPSYWAEKCVASGTEQVERYSPDVFIARVKEWLDERDESEEVKEAAEREVLWAADDGEYAARQATMDFEFDGRMVFPDFWEVDLNEWTFQYLWICYAIVRGIQQYYALK